jgi:hypothetical protein
VSVGAVPVATLVTALPMTLLGRPAPVAAAPEGQQVLHKIQQMITDRVMFVYSSPYEDLKLRKK